MYKERIKRLIDITITLPALIALSSIIAVIALLVRVKHGSPVLFRQQRPGLDGKPFSIYKFRTMTNEKDQDGNLLPSEQRLTSFGRLMRSTSLDELPELWNVLKGDMSLVGPRPLLMDYLSLYSPEQARRHSVRPGITGLAQVRGRNAISWEEKFSLDTWYVDNMSFALDLKIMLWTIGQVLKREGISPKDSEIMSRFTGSANEKSRQQKPEMETA